MCQIWLETHIVGFLVLRLIIIAGVQPKADSSGECIFRPDPPAKHISKLKFEIPDLEPKKPDNKFIVDGEDLNEKVDNCKSQ